MNIFVVYTTPGPGGFSLIIERFVDELKTFINWKVKDWEYITFLSNFKLRNEKIKSFFQKKSSSFQANLKKFKEHVRKINSIYNFTSNWVSFDPITNAGENADHKTKKEIVNKEDKKDEMRSKREAFKNNVSMRLWYWNATASIFLKLDLNAIKLVCNMSHIVTVSYDID